MMNAKVIQKTRASFLRANFSIKQYRKWILIELEVDIQSGNIKSNNSAAIPKPLRIADHNGNFLTYYYVSKMHLI